MLDSLNSMNSELSVLADNLRAKHLMVQEPSTTNKVEPIAMLTSPSPIPISSPTTTETPQQTESDVSLSLCFLEFM